MIPIIIKQDKGSHKQDKDSVRLTFCLPWIEAVFWVMLLIHSVNATGKLFMILIIIKQYQDFSEQHSKINLLSSLNGGCFHDHVIDTFRQCYG